MVQITKCFIIKFGCNISTIIRGSLLDGSQINITVETTKTIRCMIAILSKFSLTLLFHILTNFLYYTILYFVISLRFS